ncbi:LysR family transcriptional regulator [Arthrobacter sp. NPDC056886]|uniref:LysR family transcriptional regulator n=1 Tax=Arthrobacter sp. NPDC056886 TaxID=3345960 RepID=UPI00366AE251
MDRRDLECFRTVARTGSVSAAAAKLHVTQPAVSKQISRLEGELSLRLFRRTPNGMALTAAGATLLNFGGELLTRFQQTEDIMRSRYLGIPSFRVGCPHATAEGVLTPFMAGTDAPIVDLHIVPAGEVDQLLDQDVDLAVSSLAPPPHRHQLAVARIPVMIQCREPAQGLFGDAARGDLEALAEKEVMVPRSGVRAAVSEATMGFDPPILIRELSTGSVAQAVAASTDGYALVTEAQRFGLRAIPAYAGGEPVTITLYASWDVHHFASAELRLVALALRRWLSENPPWPSFEAPAAHMS